MDGPHARFRIGTCDVLVVGTVPGFVADAGRVRAAFAEHRPDAVALGVPPEDLAALKAIAEAAQPPELPEPDDATARLLELVQRFGPTRIPSPDLEAAYGAARDAVVPVSALDMDDLAHTEAYTSRVKFRHVVRSNSLRRRILREPFEDAADAYGLAVAWEAYLARLKPLRDVEELRESWMAGRLREAAAGRGRLLCILPVARMAGVVRGAEAPHASAKP